MPDAPTTRQGKRKPGWIAFGSLLPCNLAVESRVLLAESGEQAKHHHTLGMSLVLAMPEGIRRKLIDRVVLDTHRTPDEFNPEDIWALLVEQLNHKPA